jgi:cardiolipin synthase A/B
MSRTRKALVGAGIAILLLLAIIGFLSQTRGTPVRYVIAGESERLPPVSDSLFLRTMELFTGVHVTPGHRLNQLLNGNGTYPRLWADISSATSTLTIQMYFSLPGAVADTFANRLIERSRNGVKVLLLLDAFGSQKLIGDWSERLEREGVSVARLRPIRLRSLYKATQRSHVRAVVVDGRIGYTGGFGIADYWLGDGRTDEQWRETNVRFEGPAVMQLQAMFAAGWAEATGELLTGELFFPREGFSESGTAQAGLLFTSPTIGSTPAERFKAISIASARERLYVANSYFVPDADFRGLLKRAAARGVDVRILTTGPKTDIKTTWHAGRALYEELLASGVRIYEYQPTMMHAKSFVVDGLWATIGSMNFDNRSMALNNESTLVILDAEAGAELERSFLDDLEFSQEIRLAEFRQRSWRQKLLEWGASRISRIL